MNKKKDKQPFNDKLGKFGIRINEFGQIEHNFNIDEVNEFLNKDSTDWRIANPDNDASEEE